MYSLIHDMNASHPIGDSGAPCPHAPHSGVIGSVFRCLVSSAWLGRIEELLRFNLISNFLKYSTLPVSYEGAPFDELL